MKRQVACLLVAATSACATAQGDRINPETPDWFHRPSGDLHLVFRRTLTIEGRKVGEDFERGKPEIDPASKRIFVGTSDHGLYALRAFDGSTIWRFETAGVVQSEPLYDRALDVVYFGSGDGALYAVRASDGGLIWRFDTGSEVSRKPVLFGETLLFANVSDQLFAVNRRTGHQLWQVHRTPALGIEIGGASGPTLDHGHVLLAFSDGHVGAYDVRNGAEQWSVDLAAEAEQSLGPAESQRYLDVDTTPAVADLPGVGRVAFVASYAGGVYALDAESGARVWANTHARGVHDVLYWEEPAHKPHPKGASKGGPTVPARRMLFAASASTGLWAMDPASGTPLWRLPVPEGGVTAPVPVAGTLAIGTSRYGLFIVSPLDGRPIDGINMESGFLTGSAFSASPAAYGNRLYALSSGGTFLGFGIDPPLGRRDTP